MKKLSFIVIIILLIFKYNSHAQVTVENSLNKTIKICVAWFEDYKDNTKGLTDCWSQGWWIINPNEKKTIMVSCPSKWSIFYYAEAIDGTGLWEGSPHEYGSGIPDYFRVDMINSFKIKNPHYDPNTKYPKDYYKIFRKKSVVKGGLFSKPSVNIYLTL